MRRIVIPLSAVPLPKTKPHFVWPDFFVHLFLIGLPIALITRYYMVTIRPRDTAANLSGGE